MGGGDFMEDMIEEFLKREHEEMDAIQHRKVGFVGLGKLGLPVALSIENKGHRVCGYDINHDVKTYLETRKIPYEEEGTPELLEKTDIKWMNSIKDVVENSDFVFCPVQTPHKEMFEGITRLPDQREDFDYSFLKLAVKDIASAALSLNKDIVLIIISTVLPGTIEREIVPLLNKNITLCYNPFFIAMGTTRYDFENPEFVLLGCNDNYVSNLVTQFYRTLHNKPVFQTTIKNAELIKVVYNTFISTKIAFINTIAELCHKVGADVDAVSEALFLATDRIISTKYMRGGMGDGGGCHPRDNIALSRLAREMQLKFDWFEAIMLQREGHTKWLAEVIAEEKDRKHLPVVLCGKAFKRNIALTVGSPAILLHNLLKIINIQSDWYDPHVYPGQPFFEQPAIFFISTNHDMFKDLKFPEGSVVIDPWGMIEDQKKVEVIRLGRIKAQP